MPDTLQQFLATATQKAASDLKEAVMRLPEEKRNWSPSETSRSALNQAAECAILSGLTANLIETRTWPQGDMDGLTHGINTLAQEEDKLYALLEENTQKLIEVIRAVPEDALQMEIQMPWQKQTLAEVMVYPYWNMTYHQGQINYIASVLGVLP